MKKTLSLFLSTLALATAAATSAFAAPTAIKGTAINGSNNSKPLANAEVKLVRPGDKGANTTIATTRTDAQGNYAFTAKEYGARELLIATIDNGGFRYISVAYDGGNALKRVGIEVNPAKVDLLVFNTSTTPVPLEFQVHHLAINTTPTGFHCIERIVIQNHSDLTYLGTGPKKVTVELDVPKTARNVKLDPKIGDGQLVKTEKGWGFSKPITPDNYGVSNALIFSYDVDAAPTKSVDVSHKTLYPTRFWFVARTTKDKAVKVTSPTLSADQEAPVPVDGQSEVRIINSIGAPMAEAGKPALAAGTQVEVSLTQPDPASVPKPAPVPAGADKTSPLDFSVHHLAISSSSSGLHCIERIVVNNPSGATYTGIGKDSVTVLVDVPAGAKNVKIDPKITGAKMVKVEDVWGIAKPIPPGSSTKTNALIFSYDMDWPSVLPWKSKSI